MLAQRIFGGVTPLRRFPLVVSRCGALRSLTATRASIAGFTRKTASPAPIKVVGICGSLRAASFNRGLLRLAQASLPTGVSLEVLDVRLPLYDGDLEAAGVPAEVQAFRAKVLAADAVLFACPEYNFSMAAPLKNAIDWGSRTPNVWEDKPAAVMGAGGWQGTSRAQYHLRQSAVFVDMHFLNRPEVQVNAFAPGNCDATTGDLLDPSLQAKVKELVEVLARWTARLRAK